MQREPNHLLAERREFGSVGVFLYQPEKRRPAPGVGRRPDDALGEYLVGVVVVVQRERDAEIVLRVVQAERRVGDTLRRGLESDGRRVVGRSVADDARDLQRLDRSGCVDTEDADVEFTGERPHRLRNRPSRCRDVRSVGLVEAVVRLDDPAFDVDAPRFGIPFRFDGD
nr:hypothetical protein [Haloprofundus halobius]